MQGYGLAGDLWAIKERLGITAVSAASPCVDLRAAHFALARRARLPKVLHFGAPTRDKYQIHPHY